MERDQVINPENAIQYFVEKYPDVFSEGYIVEKTVEVVVKDRHFRLEAIRPVHTKVQTYDVRVYENDGEKWQTFEIGYCNRDSATEAFMQAMSFLWDAFRDQKS